jgi:hypothetical protein
VSYQAYFSPQEFKKAFQIHFRRKQLQNSLVVDTIFKISIHAFRVALCVLTLPTSFLEQLQVPVLSFCGLW